MSHCFLMMMNSADSISRIPSIEIYDICEIEGGVASIRKMSQLHDAAVIRLLKGHFVGFVLYSGDDTHPHLWNWTINDVAKIELPTNSTDSPLPLVSLDCITAHRYFT